MKRLIILFFLLSLPFTAEAGINVPVGATSGTINCGTTDDVFTENGAETLLVRVYPTVDVVNGGSPRIIDRNQISLFISATKAFQISVTTSGVSVVRTSSNNSWTPNVWQTWAFTKDGSLTAANYHFYVNNVEVSYATTTNGTGTQTDNSASSMILFNLASGTRPLAGLIGEAIIWNKVLSSSELTTAYNNNKQGWDPKTLASAFYNLRRWYGLNDCPDGKICNITYVDGMGKANCTGSNSPIGSASVYSFSKGSVLKSAVMK